MKKKILIFLLPLTLLFALSLNAEAQTFGVIEFTINGDYAVPNVYDDLMLVYDKVEYIEYFNDDFDDVIYDFDIEKGYDFFTVYNMYDEVIFVISSNGQIHFSEVAAHGFTIRIFYWDEPLPPPTNSQVWTNMFSIFANYIYDITDSLANVFIDVFNFDFYAFNIDLVILSDTPVFSITLFHLLSFAVFAFVFVWFFRIAISLILIPLRMLKRHLSIEGVRKK